MYMKFFNKIIVYFTAFAFITQPVSSTHCQISYYSNNENPYSKLALSSAVTDANISLLRKNISELADLYLKKQIDDELIDRMLNIVRDSAKDESNQRMLVDFENELMFRIRFPDIDPQSIKTSDDFLHVVKKHYKVYREANFDKARRDHTDKVIKMYYAFITGSFNEIYDDLFNKDVSRTEYCADLGNLRDNFYGALTFHNKLVLMEATMFHDIGYADNGRVSMHMPVGAERIKSILKEIGRDAEYIEDVSWLIFHHGDYQDARLCLFPDDVLACEPSKQPLIFLITLFDVFGKVTPSNMVNMKQLQDFKNMKKILAEYKSGNNFYKFRFGTLLAPYTWVGDIFNELARKKGKKCGPDDVNAELKKLFAEMISERNMESFHVVWNSVIRFYDTALLMELARVCREDKKYGINGLPENDFVHSAKLMTVMTYIAMALKEAGAGEVLISTDVDLLALFDSNSDKLDNGFINKRA
ncbi:MAG: hypothetical protein ABH857_04270, partial [Elusimicrobiota bacterium]